MSQACCQCQASAPLLGTVSVITTPFCLSLTCSSHTPAVASVYEQDSHHNKHNQPYTHPPTHTFTHSFRVHSERHKQPRFVVSSQLGFAMITLKVSFLQFSALELLHGNNTSYSLGVDGWWIICWNYQAQWVTAKQPHRKGLYDNQMLYCSLVNHRSESAQGGRGGWSSKSRQGQTFQQSRSSQFHHEGLHLLSRLVVTFYAKLWPCMWSVNMPLDHTMWHCAAFSIISTIVYSFMQFALWKTLYK